MNEKIENNSNQIQNTESEKSFNELADELEDNPDNEEVYKKMRNKVLQFNTENKIAQLANIKDLLLRLKLLTEIRGTDHYTEGYRAKKAKEEILKTKDEIKELNDIDKKIECIALFGYYYEGPESSELWSEINKADLENFLKHIQPKTMWIAKQLVWQGTDEQRDITLNFLKSIKHAEFPAGSGYLDIGQSLYEGEEKIFDDQLTKYQFFKNIFERMPQNRKSEVNSEMTQTVREYFDEPINDNFKKTVEWISKDGYLPRGFADIIKQAASEYAKNCNIDDLKTKCQELGELIRFDLDQKKRKRKKLYEKAYQEQEKKTKEFESKGIFDLFAPEVLKWRKEWMKQPWVEEAYTHADDVDRYDLSSNKIARIIYKVFIEFIKEKK